MTESIDAPASCNFGNFIHRGRADLAGGLVDNPAQPHIVARVCDDRKIGVDILDFLAVKEALAADDAVRDTGAGEVGFDGVGLRIHPVKHGMVAQVGAGRAGFRR